MPCSGGGEQDEYHEEQCRRESGLPEISKSAFFPEKPSPRLLSQVLAFVDNVGQIDGLTDFFLATLKKSDAKAGAIRLQRLADLLREDRRHQERLRGTALN